jgi:hypothetical protein
LVLQYIQEGPGSSCSAAEGTDIWHLLDRLQTGAVASSSILFLSCFPFAPLVVVDNQAAVPNVGTIVVVDIGAVQFAPGCFADINAAWAGTGFAFDEFQIGG